MDYAGYYANEIGINAIVSQRTGLKICKRNAFHFKHLGNEGRGERTLTKMYSMHSTM
jgi:hypothetical protein